MIQNEVAKDTKKRWQMIQNMGWQMTEWQMKHNPLNVNDRLSNSANLTSLLTVDIFFHIHRGGLAHFFPKVFINSWRRMGKTPVSFLAPHQASLGIIAWESFIWLNQISLEDSNQSLKGILQWGRKKWWWQESPRTQPCSPFIGQVLYIFCISPWYQPPPSNTPNMTSNCLSPAYNAPFTFLTPATTLTLEDGDVHYLVKHERVLAKSYFHVSDRTK